MSHLTITEAIVNFKKGNYKIEMLVTNGKFCGARLISIDPTIELTLKDWQDARDVIDEMLKFVKETGLEVNNNGWREWAEENEDER